ncbi:MAG: AMIN domain-containing protein, partial [Candidatus Competibacter sp.]|nr:AMIN domain-containing protein [Candidatus Competibacter sp.]
MNSLFHLCLVLTLAWFLTGTGSPSQAEVPSEPSWPEIPQVSETAGAPQFLMVKQNSSGSSRYPIIVRDLRTWSTAEGTRLVLDLNRTASFTETHLKNPDRVVIDITNAILGKSSRQRVSGGTIPQSFHITQSRPRVVTITLARTQGTKYKAFSLDNPDRLVIDIYQKAKDQIRQIGDTASTSPSAPSVAL